jgi:hypothetical protein
MSLVIRCFLLFDITSTGVTSRSGEKHLNDPDWTAKRNTQCNFDTVLQAISLRSQPENISKPKKTLIDLEEVDSFGFMLNQNNEKIPCWSFTFSISHAGVFNDGISELGALYHDCDLVPMIKCGTEWSVLPEFLDTSDELRNIHFEVISDA